MPDPNDAPRRFGRFELQPEERRLLADGLPVSVGTRAFDMLTLLTGRAGQLVTKHELLERVWPGLVVEENNLQVQVSALRKLLGPSALATIPGRGYRFELPVEHTSRATPKSGTDAIAAAQAASSPPEPARTRTNLPTRLPALYGRAEDLAAVKALLKQHPVVTIVGAGGMGKTRLAQTVAAELAVECAAAYPDGVWWAELAALSDGALVPSAAARALGVQFANERDPSAAIAAVLARQRLLLVLDNCEHLTHAVATFVATVCANAPHVRLLITSQETLKIADEHVYRLGALAVPAEGEAMHATDAGAIALFVARAEAVDPKFALTAAQTSAVIEICRRLDGIPLAIELAAARLPLLGLEGLRARLDERFNVLTAGSRVVLPRHQTLRATLEWSHGLLNADEQSVFRRLGVFAGSFTLEAAQQVAHDERIDLWAALDHLGALVDKSLVLAEGQSVPRYRLLETTRAYALERLAESGETEAMLRRHTEAMIRLLSAYDVADLRTWITPAAVAELDNLRAALAWAAAADDTGDLAIVLAGVSYRVWYATFNLAEGLARCTALRSRVNEATPAPVAAPFWLTIANLGQSLPRRDCYEAARYAADLYRQLRDDSRLYDALTCCASHGMLYGEAKQVELALTEALRLERPEFSLRQRGLLQWSLYRWHAMLDRGKEALACALRQAALYRQDGMLIGEQIAMSNVTAAEIDLGRPEAALAHARAAIAKLDELGAPAAAGHVFLAATTALTLLGRLDEAVSAARSGYKLLQREGDELRLLPSLARNTALQGRLAEAARIAGLVDAVNARNGEVPVPAWLRRRAELDALLEGGLPAEELTRLKAAGATMREDEAFARAFGDFDDRESFQASKH